MDHRFFGVWGYCNQEVGCEQGECGERTEERMGVSAGGRDGVWGMGGVGEVLGGARLPDGQISFAECQPFANMTAGYSNRRAEPVPAAANVEVWFHLCINFAAIPYCRSWRPVGRGSASVPA